jgi:hypothetical protein
MCSLAHDCSRTTYQQNGDDDCYHDTPTWERSSRWHHLHCFLLHTILTWPFSFSLFILGMLLARGHKPRIIISLGNVLPCSFERIFLSFHHIVTLQALDELSTLIALLRSFLHMLSQPLNPLVNVFWLKRVIAWVHGDCLLSLAHDSAGARA